jgi:hypothetical protein
MTATVPERVWYPERSGVLVGDPVRGPHWSSIAPALNHLLGRGGTLIPWTSLNESLLKSATHTYRFTIWPRYQATHRVWLVSAVGSSAISGSQLTFTDPSGDSSSFVVGEDESWVRSPHLHVEEIAARTSSETQVLVTISNATSPSENATTLGIACFEIPRPELAVDANDYGIDLATIGGGLSIYEDQGKSLGGVGQAISHAVAATRRRGLFHFARRAGGGNLAFSGGAYAELLSFRPTFLDRFLYASNTVQTVPVRIYTRSGAGTTGNVRLTMANGDTLTFAITAADSGTWRTGSIDVHAEDLSTADGRRSTTWDTCTVEGQRTAGANSLYLESMSIGGVES